MIPESIVRELRYIEVYTAKKVRNLRIGASSSSLPGQGFDFDEHKPYRSGDDVRRIDWGVTARMGTPYVRHTHTDSELNVMIVMDVSRSMELGTSHYSKKEILTFITGSLLFSALADQINVGFVAFADRVILSNAPRRTRAAAWTALEQSWALSPPVGRTALLPAIRHVLQILKRTSVVFLVSDFMTDENLFGSPELSMLSARHDVIAVVPEDSAELTLPPGRGYLSVQDLESGRQVTVGLGTSARRQYDEEARRRRETLTHAFYRMPIDHIFVPTNQNPVEPLLSLFARRIKA